MAPGMTPPFGTTAPQQSQGGGVLDLLGDVAGPLFSGAQFVDLIAPGSPGTWAKDQIKKLPVGGTLLAETLDGLLSPSSALIALRGAQIANVAATRLGPLGKFASTFIEPISRSQSFARRTGVEAASVLGGVALNRMTEDLPFPVQIAASLGGALVGARVGLRAFGDLSDPVNQARAIRRLHPTGEMAELLRIEGRIDDMTAQQLTVADGLAQEMRGALMDMAGRGQARAMTPPGAIDSGEQLWGMWSRMTTDVEQLTDLTAKRLVSALPPSLLDDIDIAQGTKWEAIARVFDGQVNRSPWGRVLADAMTSYVRAGSHAAGVAASTMKPERVRLFGKNLENLQPRRVLTVDEVDLRTRPAVEKELATAQTQYDNLAAGLSRRIKLTAGVTMTPDRIKMVAAGVTDPTWDARTTRLVEQAAARLAPLDSTIKRAQHMLGRMDAATTKFDAMSKDLADVQRFFRQYRDGALDAAPGQDINDYVLMRHAYERPELFDLTPEQLDFFDRVRQLSDYDLTLNRMFGVDIDAIQLPYIRSFTDFKAVQNGELVDIDYNEMAKRFAEVGLDQQAGFQLPRTITSILDWQRMLESARDPQSWNRQMDRAIEAVRGKGEEGWEDEVRRLTKLRQSGVIMVPRAMHFEDAISTRMVEGYQARAEKLGKKLATSAGPDVAAELEKYLVPQVVHPLIRKPAKVAQLMRGLLLRADLSMFGVQIASGAGALFGPNYSLKHGAATAFQFMKDPQALNKWSMLNADRISRMIQNGLVLAPQDVSMITQGATDDLLLRPLLRGRKEIVDPLTGDVVQAAGVAARTAGTSIPVWGKVQSVVRWTDEAQFARALPYFKVEAVDTIKATLKAAAQHDGFLESVIKLRPFSRMSRKALAAMDDDAIERMAIEFVNDLFGGRNHVDLGRTNAGTMLESLFLLTPGFTRGTLHTVMKGFGQGPQAALARDLALRYFALAAGIVTTLTVGANGLAGLFDDDGPRLVLPNLFDPTKSDWFTVPLPGGRTITPMARFRGLAKIIFGSLQDATINNDLNAAGRYWTDDTMRWVSYRQSALVQSLLGDPLGDTFGEQRGNQFARNTGVKDILWNPSTDRTADILEAISARGPVGAQQIVEAFRAHNASPRGFAEATTAVVTQLLGVGTYGPTSLESSIAARAGELALAAGMEPSVINELVRRGQSPLSAKDSAGRYILTSDQRREIAQTIAHEYGISEQLAYQGGRVQERERAAEAEAVERAQVGLFVDALREADRQYAERRTMLEDALINGRIDAPTYSEELTRLRATRAGARLGAEAAAPAALVFLNDQSRQDKLNYRDALFSAISAEAFASDFVDLQTGIFDFDAYNEHMENLAAKYGPNFEAWQADRDRDKSQLELERDAAIRTLAPYFEVTDDAWQMTTGGVMGASEAEFNAALDQMLIQQGAEPAIVRVLREQLKNNMPVMQQYRSLSRAFRNAVRATNPAVEQAAVRWLGNVPLALQQ